MISNLAWEEQKLNINCENLQSDLSFTNKLKI